MNTVQSVFGGQGAEGAEFLSLMALFTTVTTVIYLLVLAYLGLALWRRRRTEPTVESGDHTAEPPQQRTALIGWVAMIGTGLVVLTVASFLTDRAMARTASNPALEIEITGHQWWWDVKYTGADPSQSLQTANELHLPVGVPAHITLKSADVIHSFWVPNLAGKQDLIPGRQTDISIKPTRTGLFRSQCAEFCGVQHTHMALDVTVENRADFLRWYRAGLQPARAPTAPLAKAGYAYVMTRQCAMCHNITGTEAGAHVGPDLTHLASRRSIAAGTLPMNRGNLYGWVADPQANKPGSKMPTLGLEPNQLHAIVAYLETLK